KPLVALPGPQLLTLTATCHRVNTTLARGLLRRLAAVILRHEDARTLAPETERGTALGSAFPGAHVHVLEVLPADVGRHVTCLAHRAIDPAGGGGQDGHVLLDRDAGGGLAADPEHTRTVVVDRLNPGAVELLNSPVE